MGDEWINNGSAKSNYEWLPIRVNNANSSVSLEDLAYWKVDIHTGESKERISSGGGRDSSHEYRAHLDSVEKQAVSRSRGSNTQS